jgi:transposase-like protein
MRTISEEQQAELTELKAYVEQARAEKIKPRFSGEFRKRVLALRKAGVSPQAVRDTLKLSSSTIYKWEHEDAAKGKTSEAPRVLTVQPTPLSQPSKQSQVLSLTLGNFVVTIGVA